MVAKPIRDCRFRPMRRAGAYERLVNGQTSITNSPLRGLEGMAEGVRVSSTVDFDQPGKEGEPHVLKDARDAFHGCVDGVTPKSTSPTDRNHKRAVRGASIHAPVTCRVPLERAQGLSSTRHSS